MTRQEPPFDTNALAAAVKTVAHDLRADAMKARRERDAMVREVTQIFAQQEQSRTAFTERYGFARPAMAARMGDKWMVGIGGSIYKQTQEGPYNFMNALHDHALDFFGIPFLEQEETKPFAERHPAIQWMHTVVDLSQKLREYGSDDPRAEHIGSGAAWGRFAYDLYTIADNAKLHASMRRRLINNRDFQGARHELRVAALCVVAGFELAFEDESDNSCTSS